MKIFRIFALCIAIFSVMALIGCSSAPIEESKPMQAGDGSQTPTAVGASPAGGGSASGATGKGAATAN